LLLISAAMAWPATSAALGARADGRTRTAAGRYDMAREVAVDGTVASILTTPSPGMLAGAHLMLRTPSGTVDAHLGNYALSGPGALILSPGEAVRAVGVMTSVGGRRVLIVRTLKAGLVLYRIRNEHGFLSRHPAVDRAGRAKSAAGGRR
jgi:hypothetical protein